jgi:hypothetical protein
LYANDFIRLKSKPPHAPWESLENIHTKALGKGLTEIRKTKIKDYVVCIGSETCMLLQSVFITVSE